MATVTFSGNGVLSGIYDSDEIDRRIEEDRRKASAAAELEAERAETLSKLEHALETSLRDELAEEIASRKLSPETLQQYKRDFGRFRQYCDKFDLPSLPAPPQMVASFLASEISKGQAHVNRLAAAISVVSHRRANLDDPTTDPLVRAVVRLSKWGKPRQSSQIN